MDCFLAHIMNESERVNEKLLVWMHKQRWAWYKLLVLKPCNFHNNISSFVIISHSQHYCALLLIITDCVATVIYTTTGLQTTTEGCCHHPQFGFPNIAI
jgi:hypothetical protein